jgi:hypothetical protein
MDLPKVSLQILLEGMAGESKNRPMLKSFGLKSIVSSIINPNEVSIQTPSATCRRQVFRMYASI